MRPKHGRHSYKGSKFRKRYHIFDINHMSRWAWHKFLDDHPQGSHLEFLSPWFGFPYKQMRKIYNAYHKRGKTEHKKRGGFCIGDQFWYVTLTARKMDGRMIPNSVF